MSDEYNNENRGQEPQEGAYPPNYYSSGPAPEDHHAGQQPPPPTQGPQTPQAPQEPHSYGTGSSGTPRQDGSYAYGGYQNGYDQNRTTGYSGPAQQGYSQQPYQWNYDNLNQQAQQTGQAKKKHKGLRIFGGIVAALAITVLSVFSIYGIYVAATGNTIQNVLPPAASQEGDSSASSMPKVTINDRPSAAGDSHEDGGLSNNAIFKKVSPSVVGIVSYVGNDYFGNAVSEQGSGIIMSEDGYIITNAHVVQNASQLEVVLTDGTTYEATLVGGDVQTDLAVIKVDATGLPAAEFGSSDQLEVGDRVVAIGNPGGLQFANSLTVGYVSAKNRVLSTGDVGYALECIQTDAAINPGNSGGALINAYGQVVGINSAKIAAENFEGMGFAIPINDAMPILEDLIANKKVTGRAMLGITASEISAQQAVQNRIPLGLQIQSFTEGSDLPAKGAKVGDIVTHINGTPVYNTTGSADILKAFKPGDTVTLTLYRIDPRGRNTSFDIDVVLTSS